MDARAQRGGLARHARLHAQAYPSFRTQPLEPGPGIVQRLQQGQPVTRPRLRLAFERVDGQLQGAREQGQHARGQLAVGRCGIAAVAQLLAQRAGVRIGAVGHGELHVHVDQPHPQFQIAGTGAVQPPQFVHAALPVEAGRRLQQPFSGVDQGHRAHHVVGIVLPGVSFP